MELTRQHDPSATLGPRIALVHERSPGQRSLSTLLIGSLLLLLCTAAFAFGLQRGYYGFTEYGLIAAAAWGWPWLFVGSIMLLPVAGWLFIVLRRPQGAISIHELGLHANLAGQKEAVISWGAIAGVHYEAVQTILLIFPLPKRHRLTLVMRDGGQIALHTRIDQLGRVAEQIKQHYYPLRLPEYRRSLEAGISVPFGPLALEPGGVKWEDDRYSWDQIEEIKVNHGYLVIRLTSRRSMRVHAFDVTDLELLLILIQERVT